MIDFRGVKITSDAGVIMLRDIDERFGIIAPIEERIEDFRSQRHPRYTVVQPIIKVILAGTAFIRFFVSPVTVPAWVRSSVPAVPIQLSVATGHIFNCSGLEGQCRLCQSRALRVLSGQQNHLFYSAPRQ